MMLSEPDRHLGRKENGSRDKGMGWFPSKQVEYLTEDNLFAVCTGHSIIRI
jgi:hypothetical protein